VLTLVGPEEPRRELRTLRLPRPIFPSFDYVSGQCACKAGALTEALPLVIDARTRISPRAPNYNRPRAFPVLLLASRRVGGGGGAGASGNRSGDPGGRLTSSPSGGKGLRTLPGGRRFVRGGPTKKYSRAQTMNVTPIALPIKRFRR
jgi:hypothetical protein